MGNKDAKWKDTVSSNILAKLVLALGCEVSLPLRGLSPNPEYRRGCPWAAAMVLCPSPGASPTSTALTDHCIPVLTDEQKSRIQAMKPMTKEEWDARQSVIRRVVDPETGRTRYDPGEEGAGLSVPIHAEWAGGLEDACPWHGTTTPGPRSPSAAKA